MGCSSGHLPCQPPATAQLPTLDPDSNLSHDGRAPSNASKTPENLSTLERLTQATGGTEKSWYRCVFPFGVISLVIGMAGTGVTFTFNTLLQTKVVSLGLLIVGFVLLLVAAACWRVHRAKRKEKKEGVFFSAEQGTL
ncbi:transmembrane protein 100-like [Clarias gariepinus]|uniref:transmembrane protein 100-like n=1 Tax=Clarias gariepinus TaxID=13013 RepID=UPI00234C6655|nr:transmembrane protein 100-like [Clarias gariepinus]